MERSQRTNLAFFFFKMNEIQIFWPYLQLKNTKTHEVTFPISVEPFSQSVRLMPSKCPSHSLFWIQILLKVWALMTHNINCSPPTHLPPNGKILYMNKGGHNDPEYYVSRYIKKACCKPYENIQLDSKRFKHR